MLCRRLVFPIIIVALIGSLLSASVPMATQPAHAAPNQDITTELVPSNWPMIPSGLGPGDTFRLIFVTRGLTDATTSGPAGIARYNAFVRDDAKENNEFKSNIRSKITALVSVHDAASADDNTKTRSWDPGANSPIYWVYGEKVADNYADFYDGSWDSRQARLPDGGFMLGETVTLHTGSNQTGKHLFDSGLNMGLGAPPRWWVDFGIRKSGRGVLHLRSGGVGKEISDWIHNSSDRYRFYGISPLLKVRSTTGPNPTIAGPESVVIGLPFDVTVTFPEDSQINGMDLSDIQVNAGSVSNLRSTSGTGTTFTVTITLADYFADYPTVKVSMGAGVVTDVNGWSNVASNTFKVDVKEGETAPGLPVRGDEGVEGGL